MNHPQTSENVWRRDGESRERQLSEQLLRLLQEENMVQFPAFPEAFGRLTPVPADRLETVFATDGSSLYYSPRLLCAAFLRSGSQVKASYLHVHLHCLCLHIEQTPVRQAPLWDEACDLSAALLAGLLLPQPDRQLLLEIRRAVQEAGQSLPGGYADAASLLPCLTHSPSLRRFAAVCALDSHAPWYPASKAGDEPLAGALPSRPQGRSPRSLQGNGGPARQWQEPSAKLKRFLLGGGSQRGQGQGASAEQAQLRKRDEIDYREFLHRFAVPREEMILDTGSFDYIPYCYGLAAYGDMPFLEPLEYSEGNRLDELAIAIDTSGSCSGRIVRRFLEETWNILRQKENFFSRMRLHLIQCDSMIQEHRIFTSVEEWEAALPDIRILGQGNTDFRPVFRHLEQMLRRKEIRHLRGLLYFTDGDGIYPHRRPPFDTAFVFLNQKLEKQKIPSWAIRLNLNLPEDRL